MDLLETADRLFTGALPIEEHHPFTTSGQLAEIQPGLAFVDAFANSAAVDTDDGPRRRRHERRVPRQGGARDRAALVGEPARHRDLHARPHRPRLRRRALRGGSPHERMGAAARRRARARRRPLRPLHPHRRLQRGDQPAAVQGAGTALAGRVPLSRTRRTATTSRSTSAASASSCITLAARPTTARGCGRPDRKVLFTGDLFIWASPNCGNPQKVQRYARDWAQAFRAMAALDAEVLLPGHGLPIVGADRVRQALTEGAELLEIVARPDARAHERGRAPRRHRAHGARARASARTPVPAADLRRARVRRAQHLALLRRLVRRRSVAPQAGARRPRSPGSSRRSRAARRGSPTGRASSRPRATSGSPATSRSSPRRRRPTTRACTQRAPRCSGSAPREEASTMSKGIFSWAEHESRDESKARRAKGIGR